MTPRATHIPTSDRPASVRGARTTLAPLHASRFRGNSGVRRAFTLIEMLVVVSIIVILAGITFPVIGALSDGSRESSAINAISAAVDTARNFATRGSVPGFDDVNGDGTGGDLSRGAGYSGAAIVFTPGGELRITENDPSAQQGSNYLELELFNNNGTHNGYRDVSGRDYVLLPDRIGVAGMRRTSSTALEYFPPPFAMRFDQNGLLINRQGGGNTGPFAEDGHVFYDGDGDGDYENTNRPVGYDVNAWDWRGGAAVAFVGNPPRRELPFERLDPIYVLTVYDLADFQIVGGWGQTQAEIDTWMQANARFVFFNRATGVVAR